METNSLCPLRHKNVDDAILESFICPSCKKMTKFAWYRYQHVSGDSFIYRCPACSLEFMRPLPLSEIKQRQMDSVDDAEMFNSQLLRTLHERLIIWPEIRKVRSMLGRNDFSMLDIGCGTGWISRIWAGSGVRVTGLEPSQTRAAIARERGLRVLSCYVEEMSSDEKFDLIVIRHVIEHLGEPAAILSNLVPRLSPGGVLLIVVPNIDCIGRKIFDTNWTWVLPWHCNFFNPLSLRTLLENCGYDTVKMYQTPSPLWYPESFSRKFPHMGAFLSTTPLSMLLFMPVIGWGYLTGFSDNLTVLARAKQSA
jgi:SAM-dependent methyltransferase